MPGRLQTTRIELNETQETALAQQIHVALTHALEAHKAREEKLAELLARYKKEPETKEKSYPWPGASNVVVPLVQIVVDAIVARLMKSVFAAKTQFEVEIKSPAFEMKEKDVRDWCEHFFRTSGSRDRLRSIFFDLALNGEAVVKPMWTRKTRAHHFYDEAGVVQEKEIVDYEGPVWLSPAPADVVGPSGFDEWDERPWVAQRLRYTYGQLLQIAEEMEYEKVEELRAFAKAREDVRYKTVKSTSDVTAAESNVDWPITLFEIWGYFEIPYVTDSGAEGEDPAYGKKYCEVILTYCMEARKFVKRIYNPFFGRARFLRRIPYLVQAHEVHGMGAAEQSLSGQIEASTIHNQIIDAATAANGGITVVSPESNIANQERVYPGKVIVDPNPDKVRILHLAEASITLQNMLPQVIRMTETSTGVSAYNLGMESAIVGSQATATGTTALINEGNQRFWVSIDDMRDALVDVLYLTIQLVQQMQPEGVKIADDRVIKFPQGDVRTSLGLTLNMASEALNKDVELQNLQVLMAVLNEYYARVLNASAMIFNPQFPPEQKAAAIAVMQSAHDIVKRFVERFSVENVDTIVPNLLTVLQKAQNPNGGQPATEQAPPVPGPIGAPQGPPGGTGAMPSNPAY